MEQTSDTLNYLVCVRPYATACVLLPVGAGAAAGAADSRDIGITRSARRRGNSHGHSGRPQRHGKAHGFNRI